MQHPSFFSGRCAAHNNITHPHKLPIRRPCPHYCLVNNHRFLAKEVFGGSRVTRRFPILPEARDPGTSDAVSRGRPGISEELFGQNCLEFSSERINVSFSRN